MPITLIAHPEDMRLTALVEAALVRSFSRSGVRLGSGTEGAIANGCYLFLNPGDEYCPLFEKLLAERAKIAVFGRLGAALGSLLGVSVKPLEPETLGVQEFLARFSSTPELLAQSPSNPYDQTAVSVCYGADLSILKRLPTRQRPLLRYDFTNEWNTLGFGAILADQSEWSVAQMATLTTALPVAHLEDKQGQVISAYAALAAAGEAEVLWFNRPVGPIDSWEWVIVEDFFSHYRAFDLPCVPHLREVPVGYAGAVTMRLDCDQAIAAARPLFELYHDAGLPLSLAVVTGLPPQTEDMALLRDVIAAGGSVVSHSVSHPPNWGVDYAEALQQAQNSKGWLEEHLPEVSPVRYAVSPFHQNPPYAVQALAEAGYAGFVGGIIHNDPEYLLGRAGRVPLCDTPIISHSQQCMLHGDCYHRYSNSVAPYCESFTNHLKAGSIFGYLDHPFSDYQYGWTTEEERLAAHAELIQFIQSHKDIWFPNLAQCLEFVRKRDRIQVTVDGHDRLQVTCPSASDFAPGIPSVALSWRGETIDLKV